MFQSVWLLSLLEAVPQELDLISLALHWDLRPKTLWVSYSGFDYRRKKVLFGGLVLGSLYWRPQKVVTNSRSPAALQVFPYV